ncbi:MAG: hypothetical protein ACHQIM_22085 [Sphingobacteriales bacterium]
MKLKLFFLAIALTILLSCNTKTKNDSQPAIQLNGTWQLITGTTITKGVSEVTDYTKGQKFIKIINDTHFAFLKHNLNTPKDSLNHFDAGGGSYTLAGNKYTEHLDFYVDKNWEGKTFDFTVSLKNDTLTQTGLEKVEKENINRTIIEKYVKVKQ